MSLKLSNSPSRKWLSETFHLTVELACANAAIDFGAVLDRAALLKAFRPMEHE
ncbi:phage late control D family protein [Achromobacter mucicolens]|uniref:hypothetical protein n=1 Tax=Achromobacter mucicolens TaxID=1389922 RepID=UPI00244AA357|nr:hypothetical protein [Achromobacter mucicolens]MDH0093148.1 phage late control D family protein [Achromobacter mucicolens]